MFDPSLKRDNREIAILVQIDFSALKDQENLEEFRELALSAGTNPIAVITSARKNPNAKYFIGAGKALEIQQCIQFHQATIVLFNNELTPAQQRNLEKLLSCRVLDRTELILDIFAQRARTFEGKLQVELAQLQHLSTRLVRGWTHLERQKGGIGLRGPGEKQLETDRRLIRIRIKAIQKRLEKVHKQRQQIRRKRLKSETPTISLVGYTNAGKSTLFNCLTQSNVHVANKLFATLDPTLRKLLLPGLGHVVFADTVGFIRHLPHDLVNAFRATLEETRDADLLLHVIDAHSESRHDNIQAVNEVLKQIDADDIPQLLVFNKTDLLTNKPLTIERDQKEKPMRVWISALQADGVDQLCQAIAELLSDEAIYCCLRLKPNEAKIRSELYDLDAVLNEQPMDNGDTILEIKIARKKWNVLF